jgi:PAS domain S-box-containing protein
MENAERKLVEKALLQSEEKFRALFASKSEAFALCEMLFDDAGAPFDYRILEVNKGYETQTGFKAEDVKGRTALARIMREGLNSEGLLCYKHVDYTVFTARKRTFA